MGPLLLFGHLGGKGDPEHFKNGSIIVIQASRGMGNLGISKHGRIIVIRASRGHGDLGHSKMGGAVWSL